jgi:hypothetical protein
VIDDDAFAADERAGLTEATREWAEGLRADILATLGPNAPAAMVRAVERPGWTTEVLDRLRRTISTAEFFAADEHCDHLVDPDAPRITMTRAAFQAALHDTMSEAIRATVLSMLNTQKAAASAGADAVKAQQAEKAAALRARIREVWMLPAAQGKPSLNAAYEYVGGRVGCSRATVQRAVADLPHPKRAEK